MKQFSLTYRLVGRGWARAYISAGECEITLTISYLSDALRDLARAVISLFDSRSNGEANCCWHTEPGEYRWLMKRQGDAVMLRIVEFDDCFSRAADDQGQLLFAAKCSLLRLATQIRGQMRQLVNEIGGHGYREQWVSHEFPTRELEQLTTLIADGRRESHKESE